MTKIIRIISILAATALLYSCSSRSIEPEQRPGQGNKDEEQLSDNSMRISGSPLELNYDDGGILFSKSTDGVISGIRLADGRSFDYNPAEPSLKINGVELDIFKAEKLQQKGTAEWHHILLSDRKTNVYIVVDL